MSSSPKFDRPLGLVLAGGGALGAWQIGALSELEKALGPVVDAAIGFSAGALNAAAYALNRSGQALETWLRVDWRMLRPSLRLNPLSLFSDLPLRQAVSFLPDEEEARAELRCRLVIVSAAYDRRSLYHGVFEPGGRWDGPLKEHLLASCAIPTVFPPVSLDFDGQSRLAVDGGVYCPEPMALSRLGGCRDIIVLEMVRPDEPPRQPRGFLEKRYWYSRELCRRVIDDALAALDGQAPRVFRISPSRRLDYEMLHFINSRMRGAAELGRSDAQAFLAEPERFQVTSKK